MPTSGPRARSMLICQPPIYEITASLNCCDEASTFESPTGITIGDLYEATSELVSEHCVCPWARESLHHDEALVKVQVDFQASIETISEDLTRKNTASHDRVIAQMEARSDMLYAYMTAGRNGQSYLQG